MTDPRTEFALIDWLRQQAGRSPYVRLGIGDDCAVLDAAADGSGQVVCKDLLAEGVHFTAETPPELIGRKALAVNLSDIAAMAAVPRTAFVGLVVPRSKSRQYVERICEGFLQLAREWNVVLAGGDTNSWDGPLVISVTVTGALPGPPITRGGSQAGDWLMVSGALGGSLQSGRHLNFQPRILEAHALREIANLHAMLDVSDGLAGDLLHLLKDNHLGARLDGNAIPIHADVPATLPASQRLEHALRDGEDFELLFTVAPADGERLLRAGGISCPISRIGEIVPGGKVTILLDGGEQPLSPGGYGHPLGEG